MSSGGSWLQFENTSNKLKSSYMKGFLDICGNIIVREGGISMSSGDISCNGDLFINNIRDHSGNLISSSGGIDDTTNLTINSLTEVKSTSRLTGNVGIGKVPTSNALDISGSLNVVGNTVLSNTTVNDSLNINGLKTMVGLPSWFQLGADINGEAANDWSGYSVNLSSDGRTIAIGAINNDGNGSNSGHVRVFQYIGTSWVQLGADINGEAANDKYGNSVSLSSNGRTIAIGAPFNDGNGNDSGNVRVLKYIDTSWVQLGGDIDGVQINTYSGHYAVLSSDGTIVAIAAHHYNGNGILKTGQVRVLQYNVALTSWVQLGADIFGEATNNYAGVSLDLSSDGTIIAIGSHGNNSFTGHVRVFKYIGTSWVKLGANINGEAISDRSGEFLSLSSDGTIVAIGATDNDGNGSNSGHVRVLQYVGTSWVQLGADINGEAANDKSGRSVSLSSDGTIVAIGAPYNAGNGSNSGHVRVLKYNGTSWVQIGADIDAEALWDWNGWYVSLSSDGTTVAIGAPLNDGNGADSGHVRIYSIGMAYDTLDSIINSKVNLTSNNSAFLPGLIGAGTRNVNVLATGILTIATSDIRLKENFEAINESETHLKLLELEPKTYQWKDRKKYGDCREVGLIAQEVKVVLPELVFENNNGMYGLHYDKISILMLQSIKQLNKQIEDLNNKNIQMENKIMELNQRRIQSA